MGFKVVIPARYMSNRLPGKPLIKINNIPMVIHVANQALKSGAEEVIIATDDIRIKNVADSFKFDSIMTKKSHKSGTDRVMEVANKKKWKKNQISINVQGDEPLINPKLISLIANTMENNSLNYVTACSKFENYDEFSSPDNVKVVLDKNNFALYFSRAPIPFTSLRKDWDQSFAYHHIGIYGYNKKLLESFCNMSISKLEGKEKLEQLRAIYNGIALKTILYKGKFFKGVDTRKDLEAAKKLIDTKAN